MIAELLPVGKSNALTSEILCKITGLLPREITMKISQERRQGAPICASCDNTRPGYYLAATRDEMQNYCGRLSHRLNEIAETLRGCENCLDLLPEGGAGNEKESNSGR